MFEEIRIVIKKHKQTNLDLDKSRQIYVCVKTHRDQKHTNFKTISGLI